MHSVLATVGLLATTALATSVGSAVVNNACDYDVYLFNTPAADGGYTEIDEVLSSGGSYTQQWTELTNSDGWSIKLSQDTAMTNIIQYEYTFHDDGIIWYDLSDVNGNPWDGNWEITASSASSTCTPKQQAYRYATDDAYGMQACPQDSIITVTLCSGDSSDNSSSASASSSVAAETSTAASSSVAASSSSESTAASPTAVEARSTDASSAQTTTFATSTSSSNSAATTDGSSLTVTEVDTAVATSVTTTTKWHHWQRHEQVHRHAHA
ncbi:hypothetical protein LTR36_010716 [Oleoguttula mirabilis]|uniref:Uncharacterized protein n=1 Tax=Oleoguttula mirabilis TaxID=1507867 RepID=A0AAV9JRY9_9PEZI|nr:hypothetical protein LTR36_010716 [Oleoguttula mirabilis]